MSAVRDAELFTAEIGAPGPQAWRGAGERFLRSSAPFECVVLGLRDAAPGPSLTVAATLRDGGRPTETLGLARPTSTGGPEAFGPELTRRLRRKAAAGAWFVIVDDAGDLSTGSVCKTAEQLSRLGIGDEQIVLFARTEAPPPSSPEGRDRWGRHRKVTVAAHALMRV